MATAIIKNEKFREILILGGILLLAVFFRFWMLDAVPPGLYPDVAQNGVDAQTANDTGNYQVFYPANNGREGLFINLQAFSLMLFGDSVWSLKAVAAAFGVLTVLGVYFLAREVFNKNVAVISSALLAVSFWHVLFSRLGFRAISLLFFMVWAFYFLFKAVKANQWWQFVGAGVMFGLALHTYIASRIVPVVLAVVLAAFWLTQKGFLKQYWKQIWAVFVLMAIIFWPLYSYFKTHPGAAASRTADVSILNPEVNKGDLIGTAIKTTTLTLGQFNFKGDANWRHNQAGWPQLLVPVGLLFLGGLFLAIGRFFSSLRRRSKELPAYTFLLAGFGAMLLPSLLTQEGLPHALRSIGAIPFAFLFAGLFGDFIWQKTKKNRKKLVLGLGIALFALTAIIEGYRYFGMWGKDINTYGAYAQNIKNIGDYIEKPLFGPSNYDVIVNASGENVDGVPVAAATVKFLTHNKKGVIVKYHNVEDIDQIDCSVYCNIIFIQNDTELEKKVAQKFPKGIFYTVDLVPGTNSEFRGYKVTPENIIY